MEPVSYYVKHPKDTLVRILRKFTWLFPTDVSYLKLLYWLKMGKRLDLDNPKTFNEKLQWLKLYDRNSKYHTMVDKYAVKDYVASVIGKQYVIPNLGVWESASEIEWDKLPNQFVLKATHSGGGGAVFVCKDKHTFNGERASLLLQNVLERADLYKSNIEWAYKDIPHRIIAEECLVDSGGDLRDYKFFCFNGKVEFVKVDFGRFVEHHANYYDTSWNLQCFGEVVCPPVFEHEEDKPQNFDQMLDLASKLSAGIPFLRVDLYNIKGQIFFGELTFYPASGFGPFIPDEYDKIIGDMLYLPKQTK